MRKGILVAALVAATALVTEVVSSAVASHSTTGAISGCVEPSGLLRITGTCKQNEKPLQWTSGGGGAPAWAHVDISSNGDGTYAVSTSPAQGVAKAVFASSDDGQDAVCFGLTVPVSVATASSTNLSFGAAMSVAVPAPSFCPADASSAAVAPASFHFDVIFE